MGAFEDSWQSIAPLWAALDGAEPSPGAVVLMIRTSDIAQPPNLPEGGDLVEAPLGPFDAVELTLFGRPAAKGRIAFGEGLAVVGRFEFVDEASADQLGPAVLSALAEEAFLEGAELIYTVVDGGAPSFLGNGWSEVGRLSRG
ncbi:hypothetical protein [Sinomonas sp. P47F7]|uniref:hypothetical protein n=1 Tax=Sinomonas sp. P47F7 TaxID=3410987 RepID=UPI003BF543E1